MKERKDTPKVKVDKDLGMTEKNEFAKCVEREECEDIRATNVPLSEPKDQERCSAQVQRKRRDSFQPAEEKTPSPRKVYLRRGKVHQRLSCATDSKCRQAVKKTSIEVSEKETPSGRGRKRTVLFLDKLPNWKRIRVY